MQDFRQLHVWQGAHRLALDIYGLTRDFPREEIYGITAQLRRAAVSVAANIAEGCKRQSQQDFARFLNMAQGSLGEVEYYLMLSRDLGLVPPARFAAVDSTVQPLARMLSALRRRVTEAARQGRAS